jgi:raffinose/stachyose/melibiose transport system substrate-binding protein
MKFEASRLVRRAAVSAVALLILGAGVTTASAVEIKWLHLQNNPVILGAWQDIAKSYEAAHPDVKITFQFLENEAFKAKLPTLLQSGDPPSMFYTWAGGVLKAQSETGQLADLTPAMDADGGAWRNSISAAAVDSMSFNGGIWAAPVQSGVVSFFYNKALFAKAGVDASSIKTWDDFLVAVKKIKAAGITPISVGGGDKWPVHFYWSYLAMRNAGKAGFAAAKNGENGGFANDVFVKAGEQLRELGKLEPFQDGYLGATWNDTLATFDDGRAAMILSFENTALPAQQARNATNGKGLSEDELGRFPFPVVTGAPGLVTDDFGGINGWVVTKAAPPETVDFLKFFTNLDNSRLLAKKAGVLPTTKGAGDAVEDAFLRSAAQQMAQETWHQNYLDQDLGPDVGRVVNDMSVAIVSGQISPSDAAGQIEQTKQMAQ